MHLVLVIFLFEGWCFWVRRSVVEQFPQELSSNLALLLVLLLNQYPLNIHLIPISHGLANVNRRPILSIESDGWG